MKHFNGKLASLVVKGGQHHIMLPTGELLPCVTSTSVMDSVEDEFAEVTVTLKVNLADSLEYAKRMYDNDSTYFKMDGLGLKAVVQKSGSFNSDRCK